MDFMTNLYKMNVDKQKEYILHALYLYLYKV